MSGTAALLVLYVLYPAGSKLFTRFKIYTFPVPAH